jgi:MinD-like ATPase involved in chromosome partitioning or flagellar assembly
VTEKKLSLMPDSVPPPAPLQTRDDSRRSGILVTVEHRGGRTTLSVPDDLAVELLLPIVVGACRADPTATWALEPRGGGPIDGERTLEEAGVWQGAILTLHQTGAGERRPSRDAQPAAGPRVERLPRGHRLGLALTAARARAAPAQGAPRSALARARTAWRDSGHVARLERTIADAQRRRGVVIAVASLQPGCGKTTVAALLASLLARARPQPPLVVDGDLGSRALSRQLAPTFRMPSATYADLVGRRRRLADLRPAPIGPNGIKLLPAPDHPATAPEAGDCAALVAELRSGWGVTLIDCPAGFATPWGRAAWAEADQFVLVAGGGPAELATAESVAAKLAASGAAVAVVANRVRSARNVAALPDDPIAAALLRAGELAWDAVPEPWRSAVAGTLATLVVHW